MYHLHFNTLASTQTYLKDNLESLKIHSDKILISSSFQTEGVGRKGNSWESFPNSIAMSFTFKPNTTPTLTPLEIGLIAVSFFKKKYNKTLVLKWPNDLLTPDGKKCGGIICQYIDNTTVIVGLGINLGKIQFPTEINFRHGLGTLDQNLELENLDQEQISNKLYSYFLKKRFELTEDLKNTFKKNCFHLNGNVEISDGEEIYRGIFRGIGNNGEALVEIDSTIHTFLSSSLTILN